VLNLAQAGDNIVSSTDLYGGTWTLFSQTLKQFGVEARFVDPTDPEAFRRATDAKTRAYYAEILPNPKLNVFPINGSREAARADRVCPVSCALPPRQAAASSGPIESRKNAASNDIEGAAPAVAGARQVSSDLVK
jgi:hypothetical protein